MSAAAEFAQRLKAKQSGAGWSARCPAHDDRSASLSIGEGENDKLLLTCHAGCTFEEILAAAGVERAAPNGHANGQDRKGKARIVATYDYLDATGKLVFQVTRWQPKDFRQRRPDGHGGWIWNLQGVDRVPFHLPEVLTAGEVYVVEGEKDADRLAALGLVATCNPGGALEHRGNGEYKGKWPDSFGRWFDGRHAIILPDNDQAGRDHAEDVARKLHGAAASVKLLTLPGLPEKGDVSDWLNAGGTLTELQQMATTAPYWKEPEPNGTADQDAEPPIPSVYDLGDEWNADLITGPAPPIEWLVQGSLPRGVAALLAAMGDTGKSFKMLELGLRIATYDERRELLGRHVFGGSIVGGGSVVFLTVEEDRKAIHRRLEVVDPGGLRHKYPGRLKIITLPDAGGPKPLIIVSRKGELQITDDCKRLFDNLLRFRNLALFMLDPTQAFIHANINADPSAGQFFCTTLATIAAQTGACALASHHMRKTDTEILSLAEARAAIRGTSALVDGVRVSHVLWPAPDAEAKKTCKALGVEWQANRVVWGGVSKGNEIAGREIQHYVRADSGLLLDRTLDLRNQRPNQKTLETDLIATITLSAINGHPLQKTGKGGLYEQRERLPEALRTLAKTRLETLCQGLLDAKRVIKAKAAGSNIAQWLDVPSGPFARGIGEFADGYKP